MPEATADDIRLRRPRGHLLPLIGTTLLALMTIAGAAGNLMPSPRPPGEAAELDAVASQRRARLVELADATAVRVSPSGRIAARSCVPAQAHELARLLVQDGRFDDARAFADSYELRCGADPVVRHWGDAPRPHGSVHAACVSVPGAGWVARFTTSARCCAAGQCVASATSW